MKKKKDITTKNYNDECHGYQEWYTTLGNLWIRVNMKNDEGVGYEEVHSPIFTGKKSTKFYIR